MQWTERVVSRNNNYILGSTILKAKFNNVTDDEDFMPKDFAFCNVIDERFDPPLRYSAKGQLPSDEEVVLFSQDPAALREHQLQLDKLNR